MNSDNEKNFDHSGIRKLNNLFHCFSDYHQRAIISTIMCKGHTKSGTQCSRTPHSGYCYQHLDQANESKAKEPESSPKTVAKKKKVVFGGSKSGGSTKTHFGKKKVVKRVEEKKPVELDLRIVKGIEEKENCSLCIEMLNKKSVVFSCNHMFHIDCLEGMKSFACPNCRENFAKDLIRQNLSLHRKIRKNIDKEQKLIKAQQEAEDQALAHSLGVIPPHIALVLLSILSHADGAVGM